MTASIRWDTGTAYDFFVSLIVLHHAAEFGLRPSWAAGVRQRLSAAKREFLERFFSFAPISLPWIFSLPAPKDAAAALRILAELAPADRLPALTLTPEMSPDVVETLGDIARRGSWTAGEQDLLCTHYLHRGTPLKPTLLTGLLKSWSKVEVTGEVLLAALREYHQVFFAEEEGRLGPALEKGLAFARNLAARLAPEALIEELSRGVRLEGLERMNELTLVPSYWSTPLVFIAKPVPDRAMVLFGVRPEVESLAPGAQTPDALVNALKSLGDPTRLRILRYLAGQPLTPSELARRLRLRPPTVIHHLRLLRLAGMVHVIVSENAERRYTARLESLNGIYSSLQEFLKRQD